MRRRRNWTRLFEPICRTHQQQSYRSYHDSAGNPGIGLARTYPVKPLEDSGESGWSTATNTLPIPDFNSDDVFSSVAFSELPANATMEAS